MSTERPPAQQLAEIITAIVPAQAVCVAAELGVADHLIGGPRPVDELAGATGADADALYRLLRMLASMGIFTETGERHFALTPLAEPLRSDSPTMVRDFALMFGGDQLRAMAALGHSVRTGKSAYEHVYGAPLFEHLAHDPERARIFDGAMTGIHGPETAAMLDAFDFGAFDTIVDVGGGNGSTLLAILRAHPRLRGVVFDLDHVAARATRSIADAGLADRCRAESGSFFDAVPTRADAYLLRHIIHDWDDERSIVILRHCRAAMPPAGRVLVVESVIPPGDEPHPGKMLDVVMLAIPGGRERTADEYERLFAAAGLRIERIVPTASPVSVIEGVVA